MSMRPGTRSSSRPGPTLGTGRDLRRRLLLHHLPLALASGLVLILFMALPLFDTAGAPTVNMRFDSPFPQQRGGDLTEPMGDSGNHGGDRSDPADEGEHGGGRTGSRDHGGRQGRPADEGDHAGDQSARTGNGEGGRHEIAGVDLSQLTTASGYVATGLLAFTLLIGPANLLLRRRNPVSSYLRRDVGIWTAVFSVVHVFFGLQLHGTGRLSGFLDYFVVDGSPLTNSFGLGNWTGLAATVIVVGLLALSSDLALRKLKAGRWKNLQRLNYALFALVVAHAFFYGALLRTTSPFTLLLIAIVVAVFVGQAVGIWVWRRRHCRRAAELPS